MIRSLLVSSAVLSLVLLLPVLSGCASIQNDVKDDLTKIAEQVPHYPLRTCVVSGATLGGDMGPPVNYLYDGCLIRFCCKECVTKFNANPAKFLQVLVKATAREESADPQGKEEDHSASHQGHENDAAAHTGADRAMPEGGHGGGGCCP